MLLLTRQSVCVLGLCSGLWLGMSCENALALERLQARQAQKPQDASATLAERIEREKTGRAIFVRDWSQADPKLAPGNDGLGPMYNDVSCVACHERGGIGGGGGGEKNVRLLHLVGHNGVPLRVTKTSVREQTRRQSLHPDLVTTNSVVLHRHAVSRGEKKFGDPNWISDPEYQNWLVKRLPAEMIGAQSHLPVRHASLPIGAATRSSPLETPLHTFRSEGHSLRITERNTTSLFGAGLIDSIPDAAIIELAERQKKQHAPLITGRVPQTGSGAIGRFGWRGQMATLQEFVMTACAVEVGLNVPNHQQSQRVGVRTITEVQTTSHTPIPFDLTQEQCDALTSYVSGLPAPKIGRSATLDQAKSVQRGEVLFEKAGCAICHVRDVGPAIGLFSDLLLHDMGPGLSDPLPAMPELNEKTINSPGSGYFGPSLSIELVRNATTNIHQEWRTPPLWGVATSAPYLHDGRAGTLEQAIQWHGGEGQRAAEAFRALKPDERIDLLLFLGSLVAPSDQTDLQIQFRAIGGGMGSGFF